MTIIHISTPTSWRGGEQQLSYLAGELQKMNVDQWIVCPNDSKLHKHCLSEGLNVSTYSSKGFLKLKLAKKIQSLCASKDKPIIHTHDSHAHTAAFMAAAFMGNKTPIIVSRRVDFPVKKSIFSRWKYNHKSIRRIICVSETIKRITTPSIKEKNKLVTIHSGIDLNKFSNAKPLGLLKKKYGISGNHKLIGNVAAIADHKDYFTFVNTAQILLKEQKPYKFFIIGTGPLENEIKAYIETKGLQEDIIMTGFLSNIPEILPELDVFLITSKTEGLGTSVLDAFACKVPVVATKGGGIPEMVIHEKTGLLAEVKDAIALAKQVNKMLEDESLRLNILANATLKLQEFSKEKTARETHQIYKKLY